MRVAIIIDHELVVAGLAAVLLPFADRIQVVELATGKPATRAVDVVLYDSFGNPSGPVVDVSAVVESHVDARAVIFSWNTDPSLVQESLRRGAAGYISKGVSAAELVELIEKVSTGAQVTPGTVDVASGDEFGRWPGAEEGLSPREAEILVLICQGLSNLEISQHAYIGVNTVKTYIRMLYRKINVDSRTRAVLWGIEHGFRPTRSRQILG